MTPPMNRDVVERLLDEHRIELVRFETPDLNGVSRGKTVTADHFWAFVENGLALVSDIFCWDHECWVATGTGFGEDLDLRRPRDAAGPLDVRASCRTSRARRGSSATWSTRTGGPSRRARGASCSVSSSGGRARA